MSDPKRPTTLDGEMRQFVADLERSLREARTGEPARVTTGEEIARRTRGRPKGSVQAKTRKPVTLRLDPDVLARWRASGKGWQTRAAATLAAKAPKAESNS